VRKKNQVNALVKILTDFCVSAIAYFFIGYNSYGAHFASPVLSQKSGYDGEVLLPAHLRGGVPAIISRMLSGVSSPQASPR
jgi:Amt family ammonium transporter